MGKYVGATGLQYLWNKVKTLVGGKVDKVSSATNGHLAGLNASGNITDSGIVPSSLVYQGEVDETVSPVGFDPETDTVHVTAQVLSSAQKAQARTNIGAGTSNFSGSYNDLTNKPTIPNAVSGVNDGTNWTSITIGNTTKTIPSGGGSSTQVQADWTQSNTSAVDYIKNKPTLSTVATSGNYTDLVGAPQYVICTLSEYEGMASHDSNTYYIIIADNA